MRAGLCDAAVVGGIDCANETFIYGFRSLGLLSAEPCRPWDRRRDGLNLGEAAGFALLERTADCPDGIALLGFSEAPTPTNSTQRDPALRSLLVEETRMQPLQRVLTNSFGFGGNNCALIFGAMQ